MNKLLSKCYLVALFAFALLLNGCDSFLEEDPPGKLTSDNLIIESDSDIQTVASGPYRALSNWTSNAGDWGNYLPGTLEYQTGKGTSEAVHPLVFRYENNQVTGTMLQNFNNQWQYWYRGVRDANFAIEAFEKAEATESAPLPSIRKGLGEVRTLRAWYYFNLVRYFGDVPMITESLENVGEAQQPKSSLKTIYDEVIVPDLEFALEMSGLEDVPSGDGRVTKHVTRAIAADVYLTMAGYPYQEVATDESLEWSTNGLWSSQTYPVGTSSAIQFLRKAQEQLNVLYGSYSLGTYDDLRDPGMDNQGENIFQAQYSAGVIDNPMVSAALPYYAGISEIGDEYGSYLPTLAYINSYHPDDKRIQDRVMFYYSDTIKPSTDSSEPAAAPFSRPYLFKFYDETGIKQTGESGLNWTFYRYADILLMHTEVNWTLDALGESVTPSEIVAGINEVRGRAELDLFTAGNLTLKDIMAERAYELVFENKMLWDMRRTRRALVDGSGEFSDIEPLMGHQPVNFNFEFDPKHLLSPIPGREMDNNAEMVQNYDYLPR